MYTGIISLIHSRLLQFFPYAFYFVIHRLFPVNASAYLDGGTDARSTHLVNYFMAVLNCGKHSVPLTLDVGSVSMHAVTKPRIFQHLLTGRHVSAYRYTDPYGYNT